MEPTGHRGSDRENGVSSPVSRRAFLGSAVVAAAGVALSATGIRSSPASAASPPKLTAKRVSGVGSRPNLRAAVGTDQLPAFDHIVVVMLENHSFDNILGALGRGDGFTLNKGGVPRATNPDGQGNLVHAFHMPTPCQMGGKPVQSWDASHIQYDNGTNQGFVTSPSGPVAMGYWTKADMPFTNGLAQTYPIADRYFGSVLTQTYPNRRYLMSGTSLGLINDTLPRGLPPNGTIFNALNQYNISWKNYYSSLPTAYIYIDQARDPAITKNIVKIDQFFTDCNSGTLPGFSLVDPDFGKSSEEDPQDIQYGDEFLASVVNAVTSGPQWPKTLLVWTYDEHGGYYDHVAPPRTVAPDGVPPNITVATAGLGALQPGGFDRYGFRVPAGLVSPYAKADYVSHVTYDHTSILKLVETKWNLPAMTRRDAAAANLLDMVDFSSKPHFLHPPTLPAPANAAALAGCLATGPGVIPPSSAISSAK